MAAYSEAVRRAHEKFCSRGFVHLQSEYNKAADELTKLAAGREPAPPRVFTDDQHQPSVDFKEGGAPEAGPEQASGSKDSLTPNAMRMVAVIRPDPDEGSNLDEEHNPEYLPELEPNGD